MWTEIPLSRGSSQLEDFFELDLLGLHEGYLRSQALLNSALRFATSVTAIVTEKLLGDLS